MAHYIAMDLKKIKSKRFACIPLIDDIIMGKEVSETQFLDKTEHKQPQIRCLLEAFC